MTEQTTPSFSVFISDADTPIGRIVTQALVRRGARVTGATRNRSEGAAALRALGALPVYPDLTRAGEIKSVLQMVKADMVIHLAPQALNVAPFVNASPDTEGILNTSAIAEACQATGVKRLVYVGFAQGYGDTEGHIVDETHALSRENDLYKSASQAEKTLLKSGVPTVILRAGYLYGKSDLALTTLKNTLLKGGSLPSGKGVASFVHVEDVASAVLAVVDHAELPNNVYNIVDDTPLTFDAFADSLGQAMGIGSGLRLPLLGELGLNETTRARLAQSTPVSNARAKAELNWTPTYTSVVTGIERMLMTWRAEGAPTPETQSDSKGIVPA